MMSNIESEFEKVFERLVFEKVIKSYGIVTGKHSDTQDPCRLLVVSPKKGSKIVFKVVQEENEYWNLWGGKKIHPLIRIIVLPFMLLYYIWWILTGRTLAVEYRVDKK